jgi:hypothetical protein
LENHQQATTSAGGIFCRAGTLEIIVVVVIIIIIIIIISGFLSQQD